MLDDASIQKYKSLISELKSQNQELIKKINFLDIQNQKQQEFINTFISENTENITDIIFELFKFFMKEKTDDFSDNVYQMCNDICESSIESYKILCQYIPELPSIENIREKYPESIQNFEEDLIDLDKLSNIIKFYKEENKIVNKEKIYGCLAVDALFFKPDIKIDRNGIVYGMNENIELSKGTYMMFSRNFDTFIEFVRSNWKKILKACFVFQFNPLSCRFKPIVLHIKPCSNGKANDFIINCLYRIREILHNYRIEVVSFAFDGDQAYRCLHEDFYKTYISNMINLNQFPNKRMTKVRVISDFMHIIKRLRVSKFKIQSPFIDISEIKKILKHIPPIVFDNSRITKMHDILPLSLFSLQNFIILFEKKRYLDAAFWFPISLTIIALNSNNIGYSNRQLFLECSLWFLVYYRLKLDECENVSLGERKYDSKIDVLPYTNELLVEFSNTIFSTINIIDEYENVYLNRNSTTPLEHTFGRARIKAHDIHTIKKFLKVVSEMNQQKIKKTYNDMIQIKGRVSNFGVVVEDRDEPKDFFAYSPQDVSIQFLNFINIDSIEIIFFKYNSNIII